jgi:cytochrome c oxidase subunit 2
MTTTAWVIAIGYAALTIIGVAVGLVVFRSTRVGFHVRTGSRAAVERREGYWGIAVVAFLVVLLGATAFSVPYFSNANTDAPQKLHITGRQFAWTIDPPRVRAGVSTAIEVDAADVNHAVGIYAPDDTLVKQVNVLPGVTQDFNITFDEAGTYKIRCLEFCGVDHHLMENNLEVTR